MLPWQGLMVDVSDSVDVQVLVVAGPLVGHGMAALYLVVENRVVALMLQCGGL